MSRLGAAPGHGNFPNGEWSATIYSKDLIMFNRRASVAEAVTNNRFEGEVKGLGSDIKILLEPELDVIDYVRGQKIAPQSLNDETLTMSIDQAKLVAFKVDRVEILQSHIKWGDKLAEQQVYKLRNAMDSAVLSAMSSAATEVAARLGTNGSPISVGHAASEVKPSDYIRRFATAMDENDVPDSDRYFIATPNFYEKLYAEDSALMDASYTGEGMSAIEQSKYGSMAKVHGFTLFKSNNIPAASTATNAIVLAGHINAVSFVQDLMEAKVQELIEEFGFQYKALCVYGVKVIQPENLFRGHYVK